MTQAPAQSVTITKDNVAVTAQTPYHPEFVAAARALHGAFDRESGRWVFDVRDARRVAELCMNVFGTDGRIAEMFTIRFRLTRDLCRANSWVSEVWAFGRCVVRRRNRDSAVELGPGVFLHDGEFDSWGGSRANPRLDVDRDVVMEIRDVPILHPHLDEFSRHVTVVETTMPGLDRAALAVELEALKARMAEIEALLA